MKINDDINDYVPSILNPRFLKKHDFLTQNLTRSRCSLSLRRSNVLSQRNNKNKDSSSINTIQQDSNNKVISTNKENSPNINIAESQITAKNVARTRALSDQISLEFSDIKDFELNKEDSPLSFGDLIDDYPDVLRGNPKNNDEVNNKNQVSFITVCSAAEPNEYQSTVIYDVNKPITNVSFEIEHCKNIDVSAKNGAIKRFLITHKDQSTNIDCELLECSQISTEAGTDENMNDTSPSPLKRSAVAINLEIKKQKMTDNDKTENSKVLILNTNDIEKISHVIVQPPNYKFVKHTLNKNKFKTSRNSAEHGKPTGLKQLAVDSFFRQTHVALRSKIGSDKKDDVEEMSRISGVSDAVKCERLARSAKVFRGECHESPKSAKLPSKRGTFSPRISEVELFNSEAPSPRVGSSHFPSKKLDSIHFGIPPKSKSIRSSLSPRNIPHHKIVAGTHFAVDAFSYGDIPNVKYYFLTHFHSDHYSGLKKNFNKLLFCSKITADLCISRLNVNPKSIRVISVDETLRIDEVEVTATDANHCPGALMLVFTLPNGKTLLHTGDFRASPHMESYPVLWNRDIHTIYLDTTYCNPRYDFPTQDESLEMALDVIRQKKMALEKAGKKFSSVLIVCGTYTIGKEKFFLGMARRVGCSVWASPEKERVLRIVEGEACSRAAPRACQLHVVPMRDLTHEKLRSYLESLQGTFSEVVAFKPSGWENGKNSSVEKNGVTIHGIPYSEHSSFSELIRFVKYLKPKQVVPTVDITGGVKAVQKYFPCPLVFKEEMQSQSRLTDYFSIQSRQLAAAVT